MTLSVTQLGQGSGLPSLIEAARELFRAPTASDRIVGRVSWSGATGDWTFRTGGNSTMGGPAGLSSCADAARAHGYRAADWQEIAPGELRGNLYELDWSRCPA